MIDAIMSVGIWIIYSIGFSVAAIFVVTAMKKCKKIWESK